MALILPPLFIIITGHACILATEQIVPFTSSSQKLHFTKMSSWPLGASLKEGHLRRSKSKLQDPGGEWRSDKSQPRAPGEV